MREGRTPQNPPESGEKAGEWKKEEEEELQVAKKEQQQEDERKKKTKPSGERPRREKNQR